MLSKSGTKVLQIMHMCKKASNIFKKDRYLSAYDIQNLTQACLEVRFWRFDAKGENRFLKILRAFDKGLAFFILPLP